MKKIRASVIGASGYGGAEAVRLLTMHPQVEIVHVTAESQQGQTMSGLYPNLRGFVDQTNGSFQTGGFGLIQKKNFIRDHFAGSLEKFLGNLPEAFASYRLQE